MEKINFYYIEPKTNGSFKAIVLKGNLLKRYKQIHPTDECENDKEYYYPCEKGTDNAAFVRGLGWIKSTNVKQIERFNGNIEDWDNYVKTYGFICMFYSLTDFNFYYNDVSYDREKEEFLSFIMIRKVWGFEKYGKFVNLFKIMNNLQTEVLQDITNSNRERNCALFRPSYSFYCFATKPHIDCILDDSMMEFAYKIKRFKELEGSFTEKTNKVRKEIEEGKQFPIQMKARINYLYGEYCEKIYSQLLNEFQI